MTRHVVIGSVDGIPREGCIFADAVQAEHFKHNAYLSGEWDRVDLVQMPLHVRVLDLQLPPDAGAEPGYKASRLYDIVSRAQSVIENSEGADEHHELLTELRALVDRLADISMCGNDELIQPMLRKD